MKCPLCGKDFDFPFCDHDEEDLIKEIERLKKEIKDLKGDQCDPETCNVECLK